MDRRSFIVGIKKQMLPNYVNLNIALKQKSVNPFLEMTPMLFICGQLIMQDMPTSYFIRNKETQNFKLIVLHKYGHLAREWLEWLIFFPKMSALNTSSMAKKSDLDCDNFLFMALPGDQGSLPAACMSLVSKFVSPE